MFSTRIPLAFLAFALILLPGASPPDLVPKLVPSAVGSGEGNSDNRFPFNGSPMRYQQVIGASEFPGGPRWITHMAMRPDTVGGSDFDETLTHVKISLSTTAKAPATLSRTFAENLGADVRDVHDGPLPLSSAFQGPEAGPKQSDILIPLSQPFRYDPGQGNLLLDVTNFSGGSTTQFDAHDAPDTTARVWADEPDALEARADDPLWSVGLVIRFYFMPD